MARSTGPMLAVGAIALGNEVILNDKPINWRIPVATAVAAGMLALIERLSEGLAVGLSWLALMSILLVRIDPAVPAPIESFAKWWKG